MHLPYKSYTKVLLNTFRKGGDLVYFLLHLKKNKIHTMYSPIFRFVVLLILTGFANEMFAKTDKYRCMWRNDPATTMTIGWNQVSGNSPTLYYDIYDHGSDSQAYTWSQNPDRTVQAKGMDNRFVRLRGLQPNTVYHFIIVDSEGASEPMSFRTAPDHPYERLSIIAGGDSRNHRTGRKNANKLVSKLRPHCVMFGGDMTGSDKAREWKYWFDDWQYTVGEDGRLTPLIVARGNHEYSNESIVDLFDVENPKVYYALNLGGNLLRVYTLNSLIASGGDQGAWLKEDLSRNEDMTWKFAQYHFAIRPHTRAKREQNGQYKNWGIPFHEHSVDMVVESDAHTVKTTWPIRPTSESGSEMGFIRDDQTGTVYIGEGCWGAPLRRNNDDKKWTRNSGSFNQFKWIFVSENNIEIRTVETNNADMVGTVDPYDVFTPPANLKIWDPSNGPVLYIDRKYKEAYATSDPVATAVASLSPVSTAPATKPTTSPTPMEEEEDCEPDEVHEPAQTTAAIRPNPKRIAAPTPEETVISSPPPTPKVKNIVKVETPPAPAFVPATISNCRADLTATQLAIRWEVKGEAPGKAYQFEIQKSNDGQAFRTIAKLQGVGAQGNNTNNYQILDKIDPAIPLTSLKYRLKAIAPNGKENIFSVDQSASLAAQWDKYPKMTPNANSGLLKVRYELNETSNVIIKLSGFNNKAVSRSSYDDQKSGNYQKSIDMSNVPKGVYLLTIEVNKEVVKQYQVIKEQQRI